MAVSSRNPEHLMGGANDYRTVDIPNPGATDILGDAWLGVYTSLDGGETWKSTLLPGYPQDTSSVGTSSPLHAFTVATDPTVRAGSNGMFYYSGLVFDRGTGMPSGVFVATFQDQDNKGNGDAPILMKNADGTTHGNPFAYVGATLVDSGTSGQFLDKPWLVVDVPRPGRTATCKINGVTFSSGYVSILDYTQFAGRRTILPRRSKKSPQPTAAPRGVILKFSVRVRSSHKELLPRLTRTPGMSMWPGGKSRSRGTRISRMPCSGRSPPTAGTRLHMSLRLTPSQLPLRPTPIHREAFSISRQATSTTFRSLGVPAHGCGWQRPGMDGLLPARERLDSGHVWFAHHDHDVAQRFDRSWTTPDRRRQQRSDAASMATSSCHRSASPTARWR